MEALFAHPCGLWKSNTQEVWTGDIAREPRDLLGGEGLQFWCLLFWGSVFLWQGSSPDRDKRSRENPRKLWKEIYPKDESIWTKDWYLTHFLVGVGDLSQSVQSFSHVRLLVTPRIATWQASLSITNTQSLFKLMSIESVMPSNHLILWGPLHLLPSIIPSIRVFSNESILRIRWPKYWSFSFSISPSNEYSGLISLGWTGWISLQSKGLSRILSNTTLQKHQFFGTQLSLYSNFHIHTWLLEKS